MATTARVNNSVIGIANQMPGVPNHKGSNTNEGISNTVRKETSDKWNTELKKFRIKGATPEQEEIFYTGIYHMYVAPSLFSDVDGT